MKRILVFFIMIVLAYSSAYAQGYVFRVMLNKGENSYGSSEKWEKLVTGAKLQEQQSIKVEEGGYVALVHSSGATVELKQKGDFEVAELDKKLSGAESSLLQKYTKYIMDNISDEGHHRLSATGAVTRSIIDIKVYMMVYARYFGKEQIFDWEDVKGAKGYVVTLRDKFDDQIMKKEVTESEVMFDFSDPKLKNEELVSVFITVKGENSGKSDGYGLKPLKDDELMKVKTEYENLSKLADMQTSLGLLLVATFFEENNLYSDAITHYKKAIKLSPDVEDYSKLYIDFLERSGLKDKKPN